MGNQYSHLSHTTTSISNSSSSSTSSSFCSNSRWISILVELVSSPRMPTSFSFYNSNSSSNRTTISNNNLSCNSSSSNSNFNNNSSYTTMINLKAWVKPPTWFQKMDTSKMLSNSSSSSNFNSKGWTILTSRNLNSNRRNSKFSSSYSSRRISTCPICKINSRCLQIKPISSQSHRRFFWTTVRY